MKTDKQKQEDIIYILRSNHFVQEYFQQKKIDLEIKRNPRFQAIIWHISVMLKQQGIDFSKKEAIEWIENNIIIGEQGEIMYVIPEEYGYYPLGYNNAIQFVKYFCDEKGLKREVKEMNEQGDETLYILSSYNQDGIEEKQIAEEKEGDYIYIFERIKNRPEMRSVITYSKNENKAVNIEHETRLYWAALEDLNPNIIEADPININPLLKYGSPQFYEGNLEMNLRQNKIDSTRILPLPESRRKEMLQYYKDVNDNCCRTKAFELGIAKMLSVKNKGARE